MATYTFEWLLKITLSCHRHRNVFVQCGHDSRLWRCSPLKFRASLSLRSFGRIWWTHYYRQATFDRHFSRIQRFGACTGEHTKWSHSSTAQFLSYAVQVLRATNGMHIAFAFTSMSSTGIFSFFNFFQRERAWGGRREISNAGAWTFNPLELYHYDSHAHTHNGWCLSESK